MIKKKVIWLFLIIGTILFNSCTILNNPLKIKTYVEVCTDKSCFVIGLYEKTSLHHDNFISNINNSQYDSCLIYSTVPNGLHKMGLPESKKEADVLKANISKSELAPEYSDKIIHKKGAVGMMRLPNDRNPQKLSDTELFYIVDGIATDEKTLRTLEASRNAPIIAEYMTKFLDKPENSGLKDSLNYYRSNGNSKEWSTLYAQSSKAVLPQIKSDGIDLFEMTKYQFDTYSRLGGAPIYDGQYSVFGEIVHGAEILEKLNQVKTNVRNEPKESIYILAAKIITKKEFKNLKDK